MEKIKLLLEKPLFPYLIILTYLLQVMVEYLGFGNNLRELVYFLLINILFIECYKWIFTKWLSKSSLYIFLFLLLLAMYLSYFIQGELNKICGLNIRLRYFLAFYFFASIILINLVKKIDYAKKKKILVYINFFFIVSIICTIFFSWKNTKFQDSYKSLINLNFTSRQENQIIWILLDEYASTKVLKENFNYQNSLPDSLEKKGFFCRYEMKSKHDATIKSLSHLFSLKDISIKESHTYYHKLLKENFYFQTLKTAGYKLKIIDFYDIGSMNQTNVYMEPLGGYLLGSLLAPCYFFLSGENEDNYNQKSIEDAKKNLIVSNKQKKMFHWIHLLLPHSPFWRDSIGHINNNKSDFNKENYVSYTKYANRVTLDILNSIPEFENKTIIVSGDHGVRFPFSTNDPKRFSTFFAIYSKDIDSITVKKIEYLQDVPKYLTY